MSNKLHWFDVAHNEKERKEIVAAMLRGEPDSYFKKFRGYKAGVKQKEMRE